MTAELNPSYEPQGRDSLSDAELAASIQAAFFIGRLFHAETLDHEVLAAEQQLNDAFSSEESEARIEQLRHNARYWRQVQLESRDVYNNSHQ